MRKRHELAQGTLLLVFQATGPATMFSSRRKGLQGGKRPLSTPTPQPPHCQMDVMITNGLGGNKYSHVNEKASYTALRIPNVGYGYWTI